MRGEIIITPVGEPKQWRHEGEAEFLMLRLAPPLFNAIVEEVTGARCGEVELLDNFGTRDAHIESVAMRLLTECKAAGFSSRLYVESLANDLAVHLLRYYSTAEMLTEDAPRELPQCKLRRATDYINDHLREDLTVGKIAQTLCMSPCYFAHVFRRTTGLAPHRYVIERRIECAKSLLGETDLPIAEVAQQVGFSTQSHFSNAFHRFTSFTPSQYRRRP